MNAQHPMAPCLTAARRHCFRFLLMAAALSLASATDVRAATVARTFHSPEEAVSALAAAINNRDTNALTVIFGPELNDIKSADPVENRSELTAFGARLNATNHITHAGDSRCILETGEDRWPFPIPIVRTNGLWFFDTAAGKDELINRRVGRNELEALESLRVGAEAQREYASADRDGSGVLKFAQKFISSPGTKDGLYWPPELDGEISPLGPTFVQAQSEGYLKAAASTNAPQPFHGYYFKILTRQGKHAPGGAYDYIINGNMIGGFAFIAWPADYGNTGVETMMINQQGKIYQKDLGTKTASIVKDIKAYDPDPNWAFTND